jgi:holo-[acyl-carrier protein] synthase
VPNPTDSGPLDAFRGADSVRVGTDLCSVQDVADSVEHFGDRYLRRVYTDHELEYCSSDPMLSAERLAARFAAKEATVKVLRPTDVRPDWRTIEVRRDPAGWCELSLTGSAARLAQDAKIGALAVSMSHDGGIANAVVVATMLEHQRLEWIRT